MKERVKFRFGAVEDSCVSPCVLFMYIRWDHLSGGGGAVRDQLEKRERNQRG